jgi:L,D-transpeptidase-like protein
MRSHAVIIAATLAWFISIESADAKLDILVDKATQRMFVIQDGFIRFMWPVSTGRDATQTPNGIFTPQRLERNWFSTAYYDSPMPFSIFFHRGYAIHGSYAIDRLGGPASHGCVRLHPHHAAILFDLVQLEGPNRTTIEVTDQGRPMEPSLPRREVAAGPGMNPPPGMNQPPLMNPPPPMGPPPQRRVRYPLTADEMPNLAPAQPPIQRTRLSAANNDLPPRPPAPPPADRRLIADVRPPANPLRAPRGAGEAEMTIGASRSANEVSEPRPRPKLVEGPKVAERSNPESAAANSGIKVLPTSCWTGGASRWKWWASGQGNPCK